MNTVVTSKEAILRSSRELVKAQGWSAVNIRSVAAACHVSVGSIYNYFDSKADLVRSTVESVWKDIFLLPEGELPFRSFEECVKWAFDSMKRGSETYPGFFTLHSMSFLGSGERTEGKQLMEQWWAHMQAQLLRVLLSDDGLRKDAFNAELSPEKFVGIVFSLLVSALLQQNYDCSGILELIRRVIY